jgi:hypothetical protein
MRPQILSLVLLALPACADNVTPEPTASPCRRSVVRARPRRHAHRGRAAGRARRAARRTTSAERRGRSRRPRAGADTAAGTGRTSAPTTLVEASIAGALGISGTPAVPRRSFVAPDAGGLDGVYAKDDQGLYLLGLASPTDPAGGKTLLPTPRRSRCCASRSPLAIAGPSRRHHHRQRHAQRPALRRQGHLRAQPPTPAASSTCRTSASSTRCASAPAWCRPRRSAAA